MAGDVGETLEHLHYTLSITTKRFAQVLWTPGNHELWTIPSKTAEGRLHGEYKYQRMVALCRDFGVLTPEDPYTQWPGAEKNVILAPLFLLYDYSFRPKDISETDALAWAEETGVICSDEYLLYSDPYPSRSAWCAMRCAYTERRLQQIPPQTSLVLINHFPLRQELVRLQKIPRFSLWCGTRLTENWHQRFPISIVIYGHLHIRATDYRDSVRFEEVSFGYHNQWNHGKGIQGYLRQIFPEPQERPSEAGPIWHS